MAICEEQKPWAQDALDITANEPHRLWSSSVFPEPSEEPIEIESIPVHTQHAILLEIIRWKNAGQLKQLRRQKNDLFSIIARKLTLLTETAEDASIWVVRHASPKLIVASAPVAKDQDHQTTDQINKFLDEVYRLSDKEKIHAAGDHIFDFAQVLLKKGDFDTCKQLLLTVDVTKLKPPLMITFLSLTLTAKGKLGFARNSYYTRVLDAFARERGEEKATKLLSKYR